MNCACGISTVFWIFWMSGTVSASWVRLHELWLRYLNSLQDLLNGRHLSRAALSDEPDLLLRRDRDFDDLVDELQLLGLPALSGPPARGVSKRLPHRLS